MREVYHEDDDGEDLVEREVHELGPGDGLSEALAVSEAFCRRHEFDEIEADVAPMKADPTLRLLTLTARRAVP